MGLPHMLKCLRNCKEPQQISFLKLGVWSNIKWIPSVFLECLFFFFWPHHVSCGILVPWPGIKPTPLAMKAQSLNHWTTGEFPGMPFQGRHRCTFCYLKVNFIITLPFSFLGLEKGLGSGVCWNRLQPPVHESWLLHFQNFYKLRVLEIGHDGSIYTMEISQPNKSWFLYFVFSWQLVFQHTPGWESHGSLQ